MYGCPHLCVLFYNCVWLNSKCNTVANCSQTNKMRSTTLALPLPVPVLGFRLRSRGHRLHCCLAAGGTGGGAAEPSAVAAGATVSGGGCMKPCAQVRCGTWHRCWLLSAACRGDLPA